MEEREEKRKTYMFCWAFTDINDRNLLVSTKMRCTNIFVVSVSMTATEMNLIVSLYIENVIKAVIQMYPVLTSIVIG